ncbi:MAG: fumarate/nitrate reduction transcriptional regulator Fnr [Gammaproteobacteria bacterium]|nr:fumarate/nitrate reduction transcriptional regulator Fnr [Gammaproteobacteria bacterium]
MPTSSDASLASRNFHSRINCQDCAISELCLPVALLESEIEHLDSIIKRNRPLQKGEHLYRAGDGLQCVYAVRTGTLKTYTLNNEGTEQITGFYLPGEVVGLDGLHEHTHPSFAVALETTMICSIPFHQLEELAGIIPNLRMQLLKIMSREIQSDQELFQLTKKNAEERLAAFLVNLSTRYAKRGLSAQNFILPMSRGDIGNYLGLTIETVSRLFTRYQKADLIDTKGREIHLKDMKSLSQLAGTNCHSSV